MFSSPESSHPTFHLFLLILFFPLLPILSRHLFCPSFLFSLPVFTCLLLLLISPLDHPSSSPSLSSSFHPPIPSFIFRKKWMATASSLLSPLCLCVSSSSHGHSSAPRQFSSLFLFYPPFLTFLPFHRSFQLQFIFFPSPPFSIRPFCLSLLCVPSCESCW